MKLIKLLDDKLEEYFLVVTITISVIIIFFQVIMRYGFHSSLAWSEELARYLFLWQIWIGASFAVKHSKHLRAEILKTAVPEHFRNYIELIALVIWLCFSVFLTYKGIQVVQMVVRMNQLSPAMRMPMVYAYLSVPVGCGLMSFRLVQVIIKTLKETFGKTPVAIGGEGK